MPDQTADILQAVMAYAMQCEGLEQRTSQTVRNQLEAGQYEQALVTIRDHEEILNLSHPLLEAKAIATLCTGHPEAAIPLFTQLEKEAVGDSSASASGPRILTPQCLVQRHALEENIQHMGRSTRLAKTSPPRPEEICVYTSLYGNNDRLLPALSTGTGIDYLCFSDQALDSPNWQVVTIPNELGMPVMDAKRLKILPHLYLPEKYKYSLFVDANILLAGDLKELTRLCSQMADMVIWPHQERSCVYAEVAAAYFHRGVNPIPLCRKLLEYKASGLPLRSGLAQASILWRRHRSPAVMAFNENWWKELGREITRDQPSLGYLAWKDGEGILSALPSRYGSIDHGIFSRRQPHRNEFEPLLSDASRTCNHQPYCRSHRSHLEHLVFARSTQYLNHGSSILRGSQLAIMASKDTAISENFRITESTGIQDLSSSIIFLTKGMLAEASSTDLYEARCRNNILLGDFLDGKIDISKVEHLDLLVASSISQLNFFASAFPNKPASLLTHHVDTRISSQRTGSRSFSALTPRKVGYFGLLENTRIPDQIAHIVNAISIDTSTNVDSSWLKRIGDFKIHYAIRQRREIDGFKPFLKGFTAAATGAVVIAEAGVDDNSFYLGADYPFLVSEQATDEEISDVVQKAMAAKDTDQWRRALEVMANVHERSSSGWVMGELRSLLELIT